MVLAGALTWPVASSAAPRLLVMAAGDCRDGELVASMRELGAELRRRQGAAVIDEGTIQRKLGPPSTQSPDELERQLQAAQMLFYEAQYAKAERQALEALEQIGRLPLGGERLRLRNEADLLLAMILRGQGREEQSDEFFRRVLRMNAKAQLDPNNYAPSVRARFERLRRELARQKPVRLNVASSPSGAEVFLDGRRVGVTPYRAMHPAGSYEVVVAKGSETSLPHPIELKAEVSLQVDLAFEGAIDPQRLPCVAGVEDEKARLRSGVILGTLLEADEVVLLRTERQSAGPSWLAATLVNVGNGQKIREGGLKVSQPGRPADGLDQLASFIITGQSGGKVLPLPEPPRVSEAPGVSAPPAAVAPPPADAGVEKAVGHRTGKSTAGVALAAGGVLAGAAAAVLQLQSGASWGEFNRFYAEHGAPTPEEVATLKQVEARARQQQIGAIGLFGLAAAGLASGAILYFTDGAEPPASAALTPLPGGAGAVVSVPWQ